MDISITSTRKGPKSLPKGRTGNPWSSHYYRPDWGIFYGIRYCAFEYDKQYLHEDGLPYIRNGHVPARA